MSSQSIENQPTKTERFRKFKVKKTSDLAKAVVEEGNFEDNIFWGKVHRLPYANLCRGRVKVSEIETLEAVPIIIINPSGARYETAMVGESWELLGETSGLAYYDGSWQVVEPSFNDHVTPLGNAESFNELVWSKSGVAVLKPDSEEGKAIWDKVELTDRPFSGSS